MHFMAKAAIASEFVRVTIGVPPIGADGCQSRKGRLPTTMSLAST